MQPGLLEHVHAHLQVRVPVAAGVRAVRADAAHLRREVERDLGPRVVEEARGVVGPRQVVVAAPRGDDLVTVALEPLDEMRAEEAAPACDERPHRAAAGVEVSQSTRPIQRARFSAYQAIVFATPSSHETSGSQPVSRCSFS